MIGLPEPSLSATVNEGAVRVTLDVRPRPRGELDDFGPQPRFKKPRKRYKLLTCGACGQNGHSRANRNCPARSPTG